MKSTIKKLLYIVVPLLVRQWLAICVNQLIWISADKRGWWATQLLVDFAKKDINAYHKFLWRHHLSYAESYEIKLRFGYDNLNATRRLFFSDLRKNLTDINISAATEIKSVFEVGCSLGYLLQYIEDSVFPEATVLEGNDIDLYSIQQGNNYLTSHNSKINLLHADMEQLVDIFDNKKYDFVFGAGILLYLTQESASKLVALMLQHTNKMLAFTGLAHPQIDNVDLESSVARTRDHTWIHNIDKMITDAGGKIIARRWEGSKIIDGNTLYFIFAIPATSAEIENSTLFSTEKNEDSIVKISTYS